MIFLAVLLALTWSHDARAQALRILTFLGKTDLASAGNPAHYHAMSMPCDLLRI